MNLRVNYILPESQANGPGLRYTIWVQGCGIHCKGCSNTDTWDPHGGKDIDVDELVKDILSRKNLDGVTITGGEPLDQSSAVTELCKKLFGKISVFLTTGYIINQVHIDILRKYHCLAHHSNPTLRDRLNAIEYLDILCSGPFEADKICSGEWKGSSNQEIRYLTDMGKKQSHMPVIPKEFFIQKDGTTIETGFTA
jgi:anaerobic ribonucleoside-triphosphate reductase activating protein